MLGDAIVDEYHYCQPLGKSPKETIVSTRYLSQESFAGGILACANHIADFADSVSLVTCLGSQAPQQAIRTRPRGIYARETPKWTLLATGSCDSE